MITIVKELFGYTGTGRRVDRYTIKNENGMSVSVIGYGCCIQSVLVPDAKGQLIDVALGYDSVEGYEAGTASIGAFIGRYANRIGSASFTLNGRTYQLTKNSLGKNHIHGLLSRQVCDGEIIGNSVTFRGMSPDGEEGFPGNLNYSVSYTLTQDNALIITYGAETDRETVINFTNHSYFNLNGQDGSEIYEHMLCLKASHFTECNEETLPTGRIIPVEGTPLDFRAYKKIGSDIDSDHEQIRLCKGYDHNFILDERSSAEPFAVLYSERSGIEMRCFTDQPAVQLYSANYLDNEPGKNGVSYPSRGGICLETQHFPDSPNHPEFPSTVLRPGEKYSSTTVYQYNVRKVPI